MNAPTRIQRLRTAGFTKPANTIYVGRPGKWGNPFKVVGDDIFIMVPEGNKFVWQLFCKGDMAKCLRLFRWACTNKPDNGGHYGVPVDTLHLLFYWTRHFEKVNAEELKGKNLMCWCALDKPCHADIWLELANESKLPV